MSSAVGAPAPSGSSQIFDAVSHRVDVQQGVHDLNARRCTIACLDHLPIIVAEPTLHRLARAPNIDAASWTAGLVEEIVLLDEVGVYGPLTGRVPVEVESVRAPVGRSNGTISIIIRAPGVGWRIRVLMAVFLG